MQTNSASTTEAPGRRRQRESPICRAPRLILSRSDGNLREAVSLGDVLPSIDVMVLTHNQCALTESGRVTPLQRAR